MSYTRCMEHNVFKIGERGSFSVGPCQLEKGHKGPHSLDVSKTVTCPGEPRGAEQEFESWCRLEHGAIIRPLREDFRKCWKTAWQMARQQETATLRNQLAAAQKEIVELYEQLDTLKENNGTP